MRYFCRMQTESLLIGVCGGSGSGKTTLINNIIREAGENHVCLVSLDNYYLPAEQQVIDNNGRINFDLPTSLDEKKILHDLKLLLSGETIEIKEYNFNTKGKERFIQLKPAPVILIEGLFVFHYQELRDLLHHKVFIDVHPEIQLKRRIQRDVRERGYPEHEVLYQWENHVVPSFKKYLEPYKENADIIIVNNQNFEKGWEACAQLIQNSYITTDL